MKRKQIYLDEGQEKKLEHLSSLTGANTSMLIRQAIDEFVEKQEQQRKEKKNRDAEFRAVLDSFSSSWREHDPREREETRRSADRIFPGWND